MKRLKRVWDEVTAMANLFEAHRKARRGKRANRAVAGFELNLEPELRALQAELRSHRYLPGPYRHFTIFDRKQRLISAAPYRDRVVQHALMNIVEPALDRRFIDDCYACRPGRGAHAAVNRYQTWSRRYAYAMKLDVVRYFPSVDQGRLKAMLARRIADADVLWLFGAIIDSGPAHLGTGLPGEDLVDRMQRPTGLPIGNLTSQFFGNLYLDDLDHHLKETRRVRAYLRYVDDLIILDDDKKRLRELGREIGERLAAVHMRLHPRKCQVVPTHVGLDVLGYQVWPNGRRLRPLNGYRFRRRLRGMARAYAAGRMNLDDVRPHIASWVGHAQHAGAQGLRRAIFAPIMFSRGKAG